MRNVWYNRIINSGRFDEKDAANIRCFIMGELLLLFKTRNWITAMTFGDYKQFFNDEGFKFEGYRLNAIIPRQMAAYNVKFFAEHRLGGNIVSLKGILLYVDLYSGATYNIQVENVEKAIFVMPPPQSDPSLPAPPLKTQACTASTSASASASVVGRTASASTSTSSSVVARTAALQPGLIPESRTVTPSATATMTPSAALPTGMTP